MINEFTTPGKSTQLFGLTPGSQEIVELNEEELEAVNGGFFQFLVIAALVAYAINRGRANLTVPITIPTGTSTGKSGGVPKGKFDRL